MKYKKRLPDEQEKGQHNMVSELPHHHSFTINQPIGSTGGNTPIFSDGANPPAHQGSKWQNDPREEVEEIDWKDHRNNMDINRTKEKSIYEVLIELQKLIASTDNILHRGDLVRMYNDLLLKL